MAFQYSKFFTIVGLLIQSLAADASLATLDARQTSCFPLDPVNTVTDRLNAALNATGATGLTIELCPDTNYTTTAPITFQFPGQSITTQGFPGLDLSHRAWIVVSGSTASDGSGHTTAIEGQCNACSNLTVSYVMIDGNRGTAGPITGGANIEIGMGNQNQTVEWVHSRDPRGWSCLHIAEGPYTCANALIQNNDIGPCGTEKFQEWADGISLSCQNSLVQNNVVTGATDGGIVVFGSPGSTITNNTVICGEQMQLGGINMVDYLPWHGNFSGTVVENNQIFGGFATNLTDSTDDEGKNAFGAFMKIGLAMGSRTWFGDQFGYNVTYGALVRNNTFQGGFGYVMAAAMLANWTVNGNTADKDITYIGSVGPNCTSSDPTPPPEAFVYNTTMLTNCTMDQAFVERDTDSLTCILPTNGDFWPYVPNVINGTWIVPTGSSTSSGGPTGTGSTTSTGTSPSTAGGSGKSSDVSLGVGITFGVLGAGLVAYAVRTVYMRSRRTHQILY